MPLNLSQWDQTLLTPDKQQAILDYKKQWGSDPTQRDSIHTFVEGIRAEAGYSGGVDGSQYNPIPIKPIAPVLDKWESPNQGMINDLYEQIKNPPKYDNPYGDLLNQSISDIMNRPKFSYDPDNDPAYQAFIQRATRAGDKAYADNLGGLSAMTGGRPNSWAGTVASQARNEYTLQAQEAVIHFEERQYSRYRDETADMYNLVNLLNAQDDKAYSRFRDTIGDTKDLFDMVMKLDQQDFENYKFMADQQWKTFDTEYNYYKDALQEKKDKVSAALDRTNLTGFVNNEDSILLGVPTGTLSQGARERAEQMADYVTKQEHDLKQFRAEKEITHDFDLKLLKAKEQMEIAAEARRPKSVSGSGGSGGGSGGDSLGRDPNYKPTSTEITAINKEYDKFSTMVGSKEFNRMNINEKYDAIESIISEIITNIEQNMYGKNSYDVGALVIEKIKNHSAYKSFYANRPRYADPIDPQSFKADMMKGIIDDVKTPGLSGTSLMDRQKKISVLRK